MKKCKMDLMGNKNKDPYNDIGLEHPALQLSILNAKQTPDMYHVALLIWKEWQVTY